MEFGLKGTSRVCHGRHGEVDIVEFGLNCVSETSSLSLAAVCACLRVMNNEQLSLTALNRAKKITLFTETEARNGQYDADRLTK